MRRARSSPTSAPDALPSALSRKICAVGASLPVSSPLTVPPRLSQSSWRCSDAVLSDAGEHDAREFQSLRRDEIDRLVLLALEPGDLGSLATEALRLLVEILGGRWVSFGPSSANTTATPSAGALLDGKGQGGLIAHGQTPLGPSPSGLEQLTREARGREIGWRTH